MMEPVVKIVLAWILFASTHIVVGTTPVREPLVARFGNFGFSLVFSIIASITFGVLVHVFANEMHSGPAGLALGSDPVLRWPLFVLSALGVICSVASLLGYPTSAYAIGAPGMKPEPRGFDRITRHGFMFGLAMVGAAHALLATHLTGTVFFALLAAFSILGSMHQDAKLRSRNPSLHGPFVEKTSMIPFAAILSGRNRLVLSELRPLGFVLGVLAAWGIREAHPNIFAGGGFYVLAVIVLGAAVIGAVDVVVRSKRNHDTPREHAIDEALPRPSS